MGNALNSHHFHHILKHFSPLPSSKSVAYSVSVESLSIQQLEAMLGKMTKSEKVRWVKSRMKGWKPVPLHMQLKPFSRY